MRAFLWRDGVIEDLGGPPGHSNAYAVNNRGQVVGTAGTSVIWEGGAIRTLPTLGGTGAVPRAISQNGLIAGGSATAGNVAYHAALWRDGAVLDLGTLGGRRSEAGGVNSAGYVAGVAHTVPTGTGVPHAFLWDGAKMLDLGTLAGGLLSFSRATAINELNWVGGETDVRTGFSHAFLWRDGVMEDLGTLGGNYSWAQDLNDHGWVVGQSFIPGNTALHAFLWRDGIMLDLNDLLPPDSGWRLVDATGINNHGQIIGFGVQNERGAAFILTPPEVPEPASLALLGVGAALLAFGYSGRAKAQPGCVYKPPPANNILSSTKS